VQSKPWDQLQLPEKVEQLHRELEELIRVERINVDVRASQHRDLEKRMGALEEALRRILSRLAHLEATLSPSTQAEQG
jgi:hypothetical protein